MGQPKVYNADEYLIVIANSRLDGGQADGAFLQHEYDADQIQSVVGSGGEQAISVNESRKVTMTLTLLQTADFNDVLAALFQQQKNKIIGSVPYELRDLNGRTRHAGRCWIRKPPSEERGRTAGSYAWQLDGDEDETFYGGNRIG